MSKLDEQEIAKLDTKVIEFIHAVLKLDTHPTQF